ncbi:ubiquitin-conjugating enzyme family protein [Gigaspora margarita]|uniref:Ubiquitin-conjugating enzyme family protein n=1 Tax=Gigaspora margarita TaxID=4874 RepID=A0A8H4ER50_GIGMA|nr:ubiquitin-conjugating enzyme family protein [Gigaspora margarita]
MVVLTQEAVTSHLLRLKRDIIELRNDPLKGIDVIIHDDITSICLILTPLQGPFFVFFSDQWVEQVGGHLYNIITDENFKLRAQQIIQKCSCSNCGYNKPTCANSIKVVLTDNEINNQDIYSNHVSSLSSLANIHLSDITVNELTDDAWLHIIEFLTDQDLFLLSEAYPRINTLICHYNILLCRQLVCYYLRKTFSEAVLGIGVRVSSGKRLAYIEPNDYHSKYRLDTTFELSNTSLRLLLFQVSFLKIMQGIEEDMKRRCGYPSDEMSNSLLLLIKQIYNVKTWDVFFKILDFSLPDKIGSK